MKGDFCVLDGNSVIIQSGKINSCKAYSSDLELVHVLGRV